MVSSATTRRSFSYALVDELEREQYDLSGSVTISNGGAPLTSVVRERLRAALPTVILFDGVGSSESGMQISTADIPGFRVDTATFDPQADTTVVAGDFSHVLIQETVKAGLPGATSSRHSSPEGRAFSRGQSRLPVGQKRCCRGTADR